MDTRAMILMDTSVIVDALDKSQENHLWAKKQIKDAVATEGGGISVVALAELCAWNRNPADVEPEIKRLGLTVQDVPAAAAPACGTAYRRYATARRNSGGGPSPKMPLPDFFIGAQAEVMGWKVATRDQGRFEKYFPAVVLVTP
jgi:predicted nucleic acid-binding protein